MAFTSINGDVLNVAGEIASSFVSHIHTVETGVDDTNPPKAGYFCKVNLADKMTKANGNDDALGIAVLSTTNLGVTCDENPLQTYMSLGLVYGVLTDGIAPKRGEFIKEASDGRLDIGAKSDNIGRFMGIYGADTEDGFKTMLVQLGGV